MTEPTIDPARALVGAILLLPLAGVRPLLDTVADDDVEDPRLRVVLSTARDLAGLAIRPDAVTVHAHARGTGAVTASGLTGLSVLLAELVSVESCPIPMAAGRYARAVVEGSVRRRLLAACDRLRQAAEEGSVEAVHEVTHSEAVALVAAVGRLGTIPLAVAS